MNKKVATFIGGRWAFVGIVSAFIVFAVGIALRSAYPMPFDENYHFELIKFYAHTSTPFLKTQPAEISMAGDITRLGSYLFHYALSFPLRISALFTSDIYAQVITLRILNIGFVVSALYLFRVFLKRLSNSGAISNVAILMFCLLPVSSLLAAQINYDNAMLLCLAGLMVLSQAILVKVNNEERLSLTRLSVFISVGLLGCLVKFTFLPIACIVMLATITIILYKKSWPRVTVPKTEGISIRLIGALLLCLLSVGLFAERYGVNVVEYHSLQPDCSAVQPVETCLHNGPWARNYNLEQAARSDMTFQGRSIQGYVATLWVPLMTKGLGFVSNESKIIDPPMMVFIMLSGLICLAFVGVLIAFATQRKNLIVLVILMASALYFGALLQRNYSEFMKLHELVAVQGRYALPLLIPLFAISIKALLELRHMQRTVRTSLVGVTLGLLLFNPYVVYRMGTHDDHSYSYARRAEQTKETI